MMNTFIQGNVKRFIVNIISTGCFALVHNKTCIVNVSINLSVKHMKMGVVALDLQFNVMLFNMRPSRRDYATSL